MNLDLQKPDITYPCKWEYRVIGESEERLREIIFEVMPREYEIKSGKTSSKGHFVSVYAFVIVESESERNAIFAAIKARDEVKMVL